MCDGEMHTIIEILLSFEVQFLTEYGRKCAIIVIFNGQDCSLTRLHVHDETVKNQQWDTKAVLTPFLQQICRVPFLALSLGDLRPRLNAGHAIAAHSETRQAGNQQELTNLQDRHRPHFSLSEQVCSLVMLAISAPVTRTPPLNKNTQELSHTSV